MWRSTRWFHFHNHDSESWINFQQEKMIIDSWFGIPVMIIAPTVGDGNRDEGNPNGNPNGNPYPNRREYWIGKWDWCSNHTSHHTKQRHYAWGVRHDDYWWGLLFQQKNQFHPQPSNRREHHHITSSSYVVPPAASSSRGDHTLLNYHISTKIPLVQIIKAKNSKIKMPLWHLDYLKTMFLMRQQNKWT